MGRIKDLINAFLKPSESAKTFDELAVEEGIKLEALKELKKTQNGVVGWEWYSEEQETPTKKGRQSRLGRATPSRTQQQLDKQIKETTERNVNNDGAR